MGVLGQDGDRACPSTKPKYHIPHPIVISALGSPAGPLALARHNSWCLGTRRLMVGLCSSYLGDLAMLVALSVAFHVILNSFVR